MTSQFEDLYSDLKEATGELFPEIPNFARRAARDEFEKIGVLENPASKVDRILSGFLGITAIDECGKTAERISHENYLMFVAMAARCKVTLAQINAAILSAEREEFEELKKLKWLQKIFRCYQHALEIDVEDAYQKFCSDVGRNLGRRLESVMIQKGVTAKELAQAINFAPLTIRRYMLGIRTPTAETLYEISVTLGVSVDYLLGLESGANEKI